MRRLIFSPWIIRPWLSPWVIIGTWGCFEGYMMSPPIGGVIWLPLAIFMVYIIQLIGMDDQMWEVGDAD